MVYTVYDLHLSNKVEIENRKLSLHLRFAMPGCRTRPLSSLLNLSVNGVIREALSCYFTADWQNG